MCRRFTPPICFVLVLGLAAGTAKADIDSGLVGYWPLDGDAADASGNGLDGIINGNVVPAQDRLGTEDAAMDFPGAGDSYIELGDPPELQITGAMTLAAWVRIDSYEDNGRIIARIGPGGQRSYSLNVEGEQYGHVGAFQVAATGADLIIVTTADRIDFGPDEWFHIAGTFEPGVAMKIYINGLLDNTSTDNIPSTQFIANTVRIGKSGTTWGPFSGSIDEVRAYDRALSAADIMELAPPRRKAAKPDPPDGADSVTAPLFQWEAGYNAFFHDVYFGTNPTPGPAEFIIQQNWTIYWHAPGLEPGTTYYWRIDEVEADGTTITTGDVWSFTAAPLAAYDPNPADGARYVTTDADLSWVAGVTAVTHDIYFGTDETQVADGTGGTFILNQKEETYDPGALAKDTTYYWRIDEIDSDGKAIKGEVWQFRTVYDIPVRDPNMIAWWKLDEGEGATALDFSGHDHHGTFAGDPQWVAGYDGGALAFDGEGDDRVSAGTFDVEGRGITVACWFKADNLDTPGDDPRMVSKAIGGAADAHWWMVSSGRSGSEKRLRFRLKTTDGEPTTTLLAETSGMIELNEWIHAIATWDGATMRIYKNGAEVGSAEKGGDAVAVSSTTKVAFGNQPIGAEDRPFEGIIDDVRIYNKGVTAAEIPEIMRGDPLLAWNPTPADQSVPDVEAAATLSFSPGENAVQHDVYLGTDPDAVDDADMSDTTGIYRGRHAAPSYIPPTLEWGEAYYWRIDEYNNDGTISRGRVWNFTLAEYLIVDDFEDYNDYSPDRIFQTWIDGFGYTDPPPGKEGNGTGSTVGYLQAPFAEQTIVHGGGQSMPFSYDNTGATGKARYSEAEREFLVAQDFTRKGVKALVLWFYGDAANAPAPLYVGVQDSAGTRKDISHTDTSALQVAGWQEWNVELAQFAPVSLSAVKKLFIGVGNRLAPSTGGTGNLFIDDIRLYQPRCVASLLKPDADLSGNCVVDYSDVEKMAADWLVSDVTESVWDGPFTSGDVGVPLAGSYSFDGTTYTITGNGHDIWDAADDFHYAYRQISGDCQMTVRVSSMQQVHAWAKAGVMIRDTLDAGSTNAMVALTGGDGDGGTFQWRSVADSASDSSRTLTGISVPTCVRLVREGDTLTGYIFLDGRWQQEGTSTMVVMTDPVYIGLAVTSHTDGVLETATFDRECTYSAAELNADGVIDFRDYAALADTWLDERLWP